jgi:phage protein U
MPQIIGQLNSVGGYNALGIAPVGQAVRVVDVAKNLRRNLGLGTLTQVLEQRNRAAATREAYIYLGELGIDLALPTGHKERDSVQLPEHALFGRKPRMQYTGDALTEHELSMSLHEALGDVGKALTALRLLLAGHTPQPLVMGGTGKFVGYFVMMELEVEWLERRAGVATHATGTMKLREYVPTADELKKLAKPKKLPAVKKKKEQTIPGLAKVEAVLRNPSDSVLRAGSALTPAPASPAANPAINPA